MFERGEEDLLGANPGGVCVLLGQGDEFFRDALRFFGFGPRGRDAFVLDEGCDEITEEGLPVGGVPA